MRSMIAATLIGASTLIAVPAFAQGVYIGPNGVGVDTGIGRGYGYGRPDYDRGHDRRGDDYRRERSYEGRSAYERDGYRGGYRSYGNGY